jgi:hypothetical protein
MATGRWITSSSGARVEFARPRTVCRRALGAIGFAGTALVVGSENSSCSASSPQARSRRKVAWGRDSVNCGSVALRRTSGVEAAESEHQLRRLLLSHGEGGVSGAPGETRANRPERQRRGRLSARSLGFAKRPSRRSTSPLLRRASPGRNLRPSRAYRRSTPQRSRARSRAKRIGRSWTAYLGRVYLMGLAAGSLDSAAGYEPPGALGAIIAG